jgi:hypothetical protein
MANAEGHRCEVCNEQASYLKSFIGRMVCKNCFDLIRSEDENFLNLSLKELISDIQLFFYTLAMMIFCNKWHLVNSYHL